MKTQLQFPPQFALRDALEPLTEALFSYATVHALYLTEIRKTPDAVYNLLIVVQDTSTLTELQKQLPVVQVQFPGFALQVYTEKQVRAGLQQGALYFLRFCRFSIPLYSSNAAYTPEPLSEGKLHKCLAKAQKQTDRETARICTFFDTVAGLFEQESYSASVLALTEVLKAALNFGCKLYTGQVQSYVSLEAQVTALRFYLPQLRVIFPKREASDTAPTELEWLDAWSTEGFDPDEYMDRHRCYQIQIRMERVFTVVDAAAQELLAACTSSQPPAEPVPEVLPQAAEAYAPLEHALQQAMSCLRETYRVHSAYVLYSAQDSRLQPANCFMPTEEQVHQSFAVVLLITHKAVGMSPAQLTDRVYNQTGQRIRICFVLETLKRAHKALDFGSNFLQRVIGEGKLLYEEDGQLRKFLKTGCFYHPDKFRKLKKYWEIRINRAQYLVEITRILDIHEDELVQLHLYEEALIQTCLGLIRLFWEYSPAYTSLPYLLNLCRSFTSFPQELLETTSFKARRRLYLLTHAQQHLRYGTFCKVTYDDCTDSYHRCERFLEQAEALAEEHLQVLKRKTYQRAV